MPAPLSSMNAPIEPMRAPRRRASSSSLENTLGSQLSRTAPSIWSMSQSENHSEMAACLS